MDLVEYFTISDLAFENLPQQERKFVYPAVVNASSIERYYLHGENQYWIILNGVKKFNRT